MRHLIALAVFATASACTSQEVCNTLPVGSSIGGKQTRRITAQSDPAFKAMVDRTSPLAPTGPGYPITWEKGLALEAMCCATKDWGQPRAWCTEQQLECSDPQLQGLEIVVLDAPYSSESVPDWGHYCYAAVHESVIVAIWHRNWS